MPRLLGDNEVDTINEEVDLKLAEAEEREAQANFAPISGRVGDLSDGGRLSNGVKMTPMSGWGGKPMDKGRPSARRAWMWNGTESLLPLGWNPEGTRHDGARPYLLKRHCLCCQIGGFRGRRCPNCVKNNCSNCNVSSDPKKIIPLFYLRQEDVPFPMRFYGDIDCFHQLCPRRGSRGFKTEQDMRVHARTRHRMEYQAYLESLSATRVDELDMLKQQIAALMANQATPSRRNNKRSSPSLRNLPKGEQTKE